MNEVNSEHDASDAFAQKKDGNHATQPDATREDVPASYSPQSKSSETEPPANEKGLADNRSSIRGLRLVVVTATVAAFAGWLTAELGRLRIRKPIQESEFYVPRERELSEAELRAIERDAKRKELTNALIRMSEGDRVAKKGPRYTDSLIAQTLEEENNVPIDWELPPNEVKFTTDWVHSHETYWRDVLGYLKDQPNVQGLEIGSFEGRSAKWFLENILTHPTAKMTCLDLFGPRIEQFFDHNIKVSGLENKVTKVKGPSQVKMPELPNLPTYDFIYVDGSHVAKDTLEDLIHSHRRLKEGGVLIIDDYFGNLSRDPLDCPKIAVDAFMEIYNREYERITDGERSQVILRKKAKDGM